MRANDLIAKKRDGQALTEEELAYLIGGYVNDKIPDYQVAAWAMAVYFQGMTAEERAILTKLMVQSGEQIDLASIEGLKVDKHSTGGVGDVTTLILAPILAAMGLKVAKMSGRGLGHTGGTIDKLESIPGFRVDLTRAEFIEQVKRSGLALVGQTGQLVPADKKLYALRDVTATVESIPLIASSIMSKKIAAGSDLIMLDVKVGHGAFMKTFEEAEELAQVMVEIGKQLGRRTAAVITSMDQPLGSMIGNALEVREAIALLQPRAYEGSSAISPAMVVTIELAGRMAYLAGQSTSIDVGKKEALDHLRSGRALAVFRQWIEDQGGNGAVVDEPEKYLPRATEKEFFLANQSGYVQRLEALAVGRAASLLGAGREKKDDTIDMAAGIVLLKRIGDQVEVGDALAELHYNNGEHREEALALLREAYYIAEETPAREPLLLGEVMPRDT
ncbi:pyrimidine-nucleoside phosphorylase [Heliorestis acidaminivorans]|uniref:Pyrimidine-nucleoside phosphorylase n=1 Tax=Heliorestis acidaminivorans TaxID=553427 RepID=A0A6I0ESB4_9FIRM|nr:pyrimidine-nucleoside phosphorylase [Heliorestis acidaminivorans]KAB2951701.1 pyrimidine-nucleoside phosphorylase [Heliorestis acidaminivorans]